MGDRRPKTKLEKSVKKDSSVNEAIKLAVKLQVNTDKKLKELSDFCLSEKKRVR